MSGNPTLSENRRELQKAAAPDPITLQFAREMSKASPMLPEFHGEQFVPEKSEPETSRPPNQ
jgi:hypothetical protein